LLHLLVGESAVGNRARLPALLELGRLGLLNRNNKNLFAADLLNPPARPLARPPGEPVSC
jgi:hypothetical protein